MVVGGKCGARSVVMFSELQWNSRAEMNKLFVRSAGWKIMPSKTERQRKFFGAELARKRKGEKTKTDMSERELEEFASKGKGKKKKKGRRA